MDRGEVRETRSWGRCGVDDGWKRGTEEGGKTAEYDVGRTGGGYGNTTCYCWRDGLAVPTIQSRSIEHFHIQPQAHSNGSQRGPRVKPCTFTRVRPFLMTLRAYDDYWYLHIGSTELRARRSERRCQTPYAGWMSPQWL